MTPEQIAEFAHEINRVYCIAIGDNSQVTWENAPDWQKESAIKGVLYHMKNRDSKPEDSHNAWLAEKKVDGWTYGEIKDPEKKEHPCFLQYDQLPKEQQVKDHLFLGIVRHILSKENVAAEM